MSHQLGEHVYTWEKRCLVVRSRRHARAAEAALRVRMTKATEQMSALNQRGGGKKRVETMAALRRTGVAIVQRYEVAALIRFRLQPPIEERSGRASRGPPARVEQVRHTTVEGEVDEAALEAATRRLGWRLYGTNQGTEQLSVALRQSSREVRGPGEWGGAGPASAF